MKKGIQLFGGIVIGAVIIAVLAGLYVSGSPSLERARKMDMQRVNDLQQITSAVDQFYNGTGTTGTKLLPTSLEELRTRRDIYVNSIVDPISRQPYEYRTLTDLSYELCADFATSSTQQMPQDYAYSYPRPGMMGFWDHPSGHHCYENKVNVWNPAPVPMK